jgi:hypothetical protein
MTRTLPLLVLLTLLPRLASAQEFADPPEGRPVDPFPGDSPQADPSGEIAADFVPEPSTVRLSVGPVLRVAKVATDGGLVAAADIGSGPAGVRFSGSWVRVGSEAGLAQYQGELFIDFGADRRLHPIVGAGAGVARLGTREADGTTRLSTYGIGVLRGTVEYVLPVERADARVGIDAVGGVPAVQSKNAGDALPWLLFSARVGVGF